MIAAATVRRRIFIKITILESSPHKSGASNTLADYFIKGAEESGHLVRIVDVAQLNIRPCQGCWQGKEAGHCILGDDMRQVEDALAGADLVVYVTPIYFYGMSAQLKIVVDRLHCFYSRLRGKKSLLLATAWRTDDQVMAYLKNLYLGLVEYLGYQDVGTIMAKGCGLPETIHNSPYAIEAYHLGKSLNQEVFL